MLAKPSVSVLGADPAHRRCILNGNAFQQDAITTFNGWQYAAFYGNLGPGAPLSPFTSIWRGEIAIWAMEYLGICPGDGTIHLSYDHHCDVLRYRRSIRKVASFPAQFAWTPALFTPTLDYFPGLPPTHKLFGYVTYPRFGAMGDDNMFCSFRDGKAGLGNDHLYIYHGGSTGLFTFAGTPLTGIRSNPYVHGIDYRAGRLHVTWVYRGFVNYDGWDDPLDTKHKQQAGPNSAANNHDICYAYSDDQGYTWNNGSGKVVADLKDGGTIDNKSEGIVAFRIPKGSGLMNQEAQAVDHDGGVHVLNRDTLDGGTYLWKHYYRSPEGTWRQQGIQPIDGTRRGRLAISKNGDLFLILPETTTPRIRILKATKASGYSHYEKVWEGHGYTGEPLVDTARLEHDNVLSVFVRADVDGATDKKNVVVLDFRL